MEKYHVLVIEDDIEIANAIKIYLQNQGYDVYVGNDGLEGLEIVEKETIHLAIVDIMMPRMDGLTMVAKLREKYDFPVIFLSAKSEDIDKIMGLNLGGDDYQVLLQSANHLAQGEFNDKINRDLGLFNSLKDELNCINDGFKDAVSKEVASQKMKTELISNVSHDLKTPLTSIISYIDLLKNEDLSKEQQDEYIDILDRNTKRLKILIEDLFEVSKVNSGNIQLNPIDLDIHALLQQVLFEYQEQFEHHHLNLKNDYENKKIICHLDSEKTYRVLENLCQNICKYALEHTRVYLQIVETNQQVIVVFKNISAHEISNPADLTERFVQGDASRKSEGSGLGLAICKSFVEVQGGTFEVNVDGDLFKTTIIFPKKIEND